MPLITISEVTFLKVLFAVLLTIATVSAVIALAIPVEDDEDGSEDL